MHLMRTGSLLTSFLLGAALLAPAAAQTLPEGPQVLTFHSDVDDSEQPYGLYLPPDYDGSRAYPLVISLHGAGSNHRLNLRRVFGHSNAEGENDVEASRYFPDWAPRDYIVASPLARGTMGYQGIAEKDVLDVLADVKRRFSIDEDRVYLTGLSMGGGGTLWLGLTRPDIWAAIAPVCPAPPQGADRFAGNALNVPVRIFQGGADPVVRPEGVRAWVEQFRELGVSVEYDEYPGVLHDSWVQAYQNGQVFDWFDQHVRDPHPERVRFAADQYRYGSAYWVEFDALNPGTTASIDIRFDATDRLSATTADLDGFTLRLEGHPGRSGNAPLSVTVDGQRLSVPSGVAEPSFHRVDGRWSVGAAPVSALAKREGAEGPMSRAISERHIYVYGTADEPADDEIARRRAVAETAANWSIYRGPFLGRLMVFPRIAADHEVRPSDLEDANLILFGTRETNSLISRFAPRLPLHLESGATEHGLAYIYPNDGNYVLVSSGLPWWHRPAGASGQGGSLFAGQVEAMGLMGMGDFILFRGSPENPVAAGRFDATWRLPAAAAAAMRESGVVRVEDAVVGGG